MQCIYHIETSWPQAKIQKLALDDILEAKYHLNLITIENHFDKRSQKYNIRDYFHIYSLSKMEVLHYY